MDLRLVPPSQQRLWAEEVLYLHSLWHQGSSQNPTLEAKPKPNPNPNPNLGPINSTEFKKKKRNRKKKKNQAQPSDPPAAEIEWPVNPSPARDAESDGWPEPAGNAQRRPPQPAVDEAKANALRVQQNALQSCRDFFSKDGSDDDDAMSEDEDEEESKAFDFFLGVFENDGELRDYYEKNHEKGEFLCLVCGGSGVKLGRRYGNCVGLVQHSSQISKTKRKAVHRGFGRVVCRVLGWDTKRLPNIVLDTAEPLGQSLIKAAEMQEEKQKEDGTEIILIPDEEKQKEDDTEIVLIPDNDDVGGDAQKDGDNGNLIDCTQANETEVPNREDISNGKELLSELGKHPEGSKKKKKRKRKVNKKHMISSPLNPPVAQVVWPCDLTMGPKPDPTGEQDLTQAPGTSQPGQPPSIDEQEKTTTASQPGQPSSIDEQEKTTTVQVQLDALKACRNFLAKSDDSSSDDEDDEEMEKRESVAFKYFLKLFEMDHKLRKYYESNSLKGDFCCLVCGGIGEKKWKMFGNCVGLVQHSKSVGKRMWAHRAFGRAVCEVLAWDIDGNPSIIITPKEPVSQALENSVEIQDDTSKDGNDHC